MALVAPSVVIIVMVVVVKVDWHWDLLVDGHMDSLVNGDVLHDRNMDLLDVMMVVGVHFVRDMDDDVFAGGKEKRKALILIGLSILEMAKSMEIHRLNFPCDYRNKYIGSVPIETSC